MATFNLTVEGVSGPSLFTKYTTANTSCATIYELYVTATNGDSIDITIANGGYTYYTTQLDTGSGFVTVSNTAFTINYTGYAMIKVSMLNTGSVETWNVTVDGNNTTSGATGSEILSRDSTGAAC